MWIHLLLLTSVFATSILSGILGMAGGMILMVILVSTVSVQASMMIHGAVQATSNGSRAWFLRAHIQWQIFPFYAAGASLAVAAFMAAMVIPPPGVVLIIIGLFPWLGRVVPNLGGLDVGNRATAAICGAVVTAAQLLAGASGPLLDVFYLNSSMNRHQIIASKAVTQTLGHIIKLFYYGIYIGLEESIPGWFYGIALVTAVAGTRVGTRLLNHIREDTFRIISGRVILAIAASCVVKGVMDLTA